MNDVFIGIDNGLDGAIAAVGAFRASAFPTPTCRKGKSGKTLDEIGMPDLLDSLILSAKSTFAVIEHAQAMPKQGRSGIFNYGVGHGFWRGLLVAKGISYEIVRPRRWQAVLLKDMGRTNTKASSILVAKRLFPRVNLRPGKRRVDHHGMADALLMAEFARRRESGAA